MKKKKKAADSGGADPNAWMATFSDLNFLMITFFVLLLSMSSMDETRFSDIFGDVTSEDDLVRPSPPLGDSPMPAIMPSKINLVAQAARPAEVDTEGERLRRILSAMKLAEKSILSRDKGSLRDRHLSKLVEKNQDLLNLEKVGPNEVVLGIEDVLVFDEGQTEPSKRAMPLIQAMADLALDMDGAMTVTISGDWEISARRSASVARLLSACGVQGKRLTAKTQNQGDTKTLRFSVKRDGPTKVEEENADG